MTQLNESAAEYRELAAVLRQLKPSRSTLSAEDTFYAAGWQAATKSARRSGSGLRGRRSRIRVFVAGLACGLLIPAAGLLSSNGVNTSQTVVNPEIAKEDTSPTPDSPAPDPKPLEDALALMPSRYWMRLGIDSARLSVSEFRGHDFGALHGPHVGMGGLSALMSRRPNSSTAVTVAPRTTRALSARPLSAEMIDELL